MYSHSSHTALTQRPENKSLSVVQSVLLTVLPRLCFFCSTGSLSLLSSQVYKSGEMTVARKGLVRERQNDSGVHRDLKVIQR